MAFEKHGDASVTAVVGKDVKKACAACGALVKEGESCSCTDTKETE